MIRVELHAQADAEVEATSSRYDREQPGLGGEFIARVDEALRSITEHPRAWPLWRSRRAQRLEVRRYVMSRFPFVLPFVVLEERVVILAVAHAKRRPGYWMKRLRWLK